MKPAEPVTSALICYVRRNKGRNVSKSGRREPRHGYSPKKQGHMYRMTTSRQSPDFPDLLRLLPATAKDRVNNPSNVFALESDDIALTNRKIYPACPSSCNRTSHLHGQVDLEPSLRSTHGRHSSAAPHSQVQAQEVWQISQSKSQHILGMQQQSSSVIGNSNKRCRDRKNIARAYHRTDTDSTAGALA